MHLIKTNFRQNLSLIPILLSLYSSYSGASESYFAGPYVRRFLNLSIEKPLIHTIKKENPKDLAPGEKVTLLVWNIYKADLFPKDRPLPFSFQDYDFTLIQEETKKNIFKQLKKPGFNHFLPTFTYDSTTTGLSLYTPYKATSVQGHHSHYSEPLIITPKGVLVADFGKLRIINVHLLNFVTYEEWKHELNRIMELCENRDYLILAGDFNTWSEQRLLALQVETKKRGLSQVVFNKEVKPTSTLGNPIDHVFAKGFFLRNAVVIREEGLSDHRALEVTLERKTN